MKTLKLLILLITVSIYSAAQTIPKKISPATALDINDVHSFDQAKYFMSLADFSAAIPMFENLTEQYPGEPLFKYFLAQSYLAVGNNYKMAIPILQNLEKEYPKESSLYLWLGRAYQNDFEFNKAIEQYDYFIKNFIGDKNMPEAKQSLVNCKNALTVLKTPSTSKVTNIGEKINTRFSEYAPILLNEEKTLLFTFKGDSNIYYNKDLYTAGKNEYNEDIFASSFINNEWQTPHSLGEPFNTGKRDGNDATVSVNNNGKYLFVYRNQSKKESGDLFLLKKNGAKWESVKDFSGINSSSWEGSACMTSDEKYIYFSSDRTGTSGDKDLWRATKQADGSYGAVINLGSKINTPLAEDAPFISFDGKIFYFSSQGHNSIGGYDLFYCDIKPDGNLGIVKNMGFPINSINDDIYLSTTSDGKIGYFSSNRLGGFGQLDLYQFEIEKVENITHLYTLTGKVKWEDRGDPCLIEVFNEKGGLENTYTIAENNGSYKLVLNGGGKFKINFSANRFDSYTHHIELKNLNTDEQKEFDVTLKPAALATARETAKEVDKEITAIADNAKEKLDKSIKLDKLTIEKEIEVELARIFFDYDQTLVKAEFNESLNHLIAQLKKNKELKLTITGYADSKGSEDYNIGLSKRRAQAVANYLVVRGINRNRMEIIAKGEAMPLAPNENSDGTDSPSGRSKNRRVEFNISNAENIKNLKVTLKNNWP